MDWFSQRIDICDRGSGFDLGRRNDTNKKKKKKKNLKPKKMGRGVSAGGGQSSLGYLFGSGETTNNPQPEQNKTQASNNGPTQKSVAASQPVDNSKQIPDTTGVNGKQPVDNSKQIPDTAGVNGNNQNNYFRPDGQNCGNFITDRPSTKVHAAPGGGSSLGYLFGGVGGDSSGGK
ncbi:hypothetical protein U1Q18_012235 [Sarracenia purpurea var. burkii]